MEEFTDFEKLDLQEVVGEALDGFCDRYLGDALRVMNTSIVFPSDHEMIKLSLSIVVGLYYKRIAEGIESGEKVAH
jgi:hypothetical protein